MNKNFLVLNILLLSYSLLASTDIQKSLMQAAKEKNINLLRSTLSKINSPENYNLALGTAIEIGDANIVTKLLEEKKADPNAFISPPERPRQNESFTPLILAATQDKIEIAKLLLSYGANPFLENKDGLNAIMIASSPEMLTVFAEKTKDKNKMTMIFAKAIMLQADNLAEALFKKGINVHYKDAEGRTLVDFAMDNQKWLKKLTKEGVDLDNKSKDGEAPLISAILLRKNKDAIQLLLEAGANPNLTIAQLNNLPILHYSISEAALTGNLEIVELLLENGANQNIKNEQGQTALNFAKSKLHNEINALHEMNKKKEEFEEADFKEQQEKINNLQKIISLLKSKKHSRPKQKKSLSNKFC